MGVYNLSKKKSVQQMEQVFVDKSHDGDFFKDEKTTWDELTQLKDEIGRTIVEFTCNLGMVINNKPVLDCLGEDRPGFEKAVAVLLSDIQNFSGKVKEVRLQHEGKSGVINNVDDYNTYINLSMQYNTLYTEIMLVISPSVTDIMMKLSEAELKYSEQQKLKDPAVISDAEFTETKRDSKE